MSAGIDVYSAAMATWRDTSLGQERKGGSGTEGQTYMCEYRLILNTADSYWIFKIGLFCSINTIISYIHLICCYFGLLN